MSPRKPALPPRPSEINLPGATAPTPEVPAATDDNLRAQLDESNRLLEEAGNALASQAEEIDALKAAYDALMARGATELAQVRNDFNKAWERREAAWESARNALAQSGIASPVAPSSAPNATAWTGGPRRLIDAPPGKCYALCPILYGKTRFEIGEEIPRVAVWDGVMQPGEHFRLELE